ncbi:MAG TPA: hypothetical protein VGX25_07530 [Actinophytocola sp.]|uniref:hypothetical protein n=1 Tax=Actinophytocola sp. TaxID=1872138 RepID=UPI002DDD01C3|nr:hypothetical protein [Actinophytocola sp.]HEV2779237.1 hypothetical protein [Actinophytocola sp.]
MNGEPDPFAPAIERLVAAGWRLVPQIGHGTCDNALLRTGRRFTDVVMIPILGDSTAVRLHGGPRPGQPRHTGQERWRHHIPLEVALEWILSDAVDDAWLARAHGRDPYR